MAPQEFVILYSVFQMPMRVKRLDTAESRFEAAVNEKRKAIVAATDAGMHTSGSTVEDAKHELKKLVDQGVGR